MVNPSNTYNLERTKNVDHTRLVQDGRRVGPAYGLGFTGSRRDSWGCGEWMDGLSHLSLDIRFY